MFEILYERIHVNIKCINTSLRSKHDVSSSSTSSNCFSMSNTQLSFTNNIIQDATKMIKLSSFLFKHLKSLATYYYTELSANLSAKFFNLTLNLCGLINSVFLFEHQANIDFCFNENECNQNTQQQQQQHQYQSIKAEFFKEFSAPFEQFVQLFEHVNNGVNDLLQHLASRDDLVQWSEEHSADDEQYLEQLEDNLLFQCVLLNRGNTINFIHQQSLLNGSTSLLSTVKLQ